MKHNHTLVQAMIGLLVGALALPAMGSGTRLSLILSTPLGYSIQQTVGKNETQAASPKNSAMQNREPQLSSSALKARATEGRQLLDYVLANSPQVKPVEYSILIRIEGAILLWRRDTPAAKTILRDTLKQLLYLMNDEPEPASGQYQPPSYRRRLYATIIRKIAALDAELLRQGLLNNGIRAKPVKITEWTDEARAVLVAASEQVEKNPAIAAQLAERSLAFGLADWTSFLMRLGERDRVEAEQLAGKLLDKLRETAVSPIFVRNLRDFYFAPNSSRALQEKFLQTIAWQLQREVNVNTPFNQLQSDFFCAREMSGLAGASLPHWQVEFERIIAAFEALFTSLSLTVTPPTRRAVQAPPVSGVEAGEVTEVLEAVKKTDMLKDLNAKDREYQRLAGQAAFKANLPLAEDLLAKISDEKIRQEATASVYSPLARKAIHDGEWSLAQTYAGKVYDPLARTLMYETVANAMAKANKEKAEIEAVYGLAFAKLRDSEMDERGARAALYLAKAVGGFNEKLEREVLSHAVERLNQLSKRTNLIEAPPLTGVTTNWIRYTNYAFTADEVLDVNEMLGAVFTIMAKHNLDEAKLLAVNLEHWGLRSLAQLAVSGVLLESVAKSAGTPQKKDATEK